MGGLWHWFYPQYWRCFKKAKLFYFPNTHPENSAVFFPTIGADNFLGRCPKLHKSTPNPSLTWSWLENGAPTPTLAVFLYLTIQKWVSIVLYTNQTWDSNN